MARSSHTPAQPHRLIWPLSPHQIENIDEMFEILFRALRTTANVARAAETGAVAVVGEVPVGLVNGANAVYTTAAAYSELRIYLNGLRQQRTADYTETTATTFTLLVPPTTGDLLTVDYTEAP
jgi:hypothetical protein